MVVSSESLIKVVALTMLLLTGCIDNDKVNALKISKEQVEQLIAKELSQDASANEIEAFFKNHDIGFSYNKYANRYHGIIRDVSKEPNFDQAIVIHINVDEDKRFVSSEVRYSYTAL